MLKKNINMDSVKSFKVFFILLSFILINIRNVNGNDCIDHLTNDGLMDKNIEGPDAFKHAYFNLTDYNTRHNWMLRHYLLYLYNIATSIDIDSIIQYPMVWCLENISRIKINLKNKKKEEKCEDELKSAGFDPNGDGKKALYYAFFETKLNARKIKVLTTKYYKYMLDEIFPYYVKTDVYGPMFFCANLHSFFGFIEILNENSLPNPYARRREPYYYEECIDQITKIGNIDINFNGTQAFEYAYLNFNMYLMSGNKKVILCQYLQDLYDAATSNYTDDKFQNPVDWCMDNIPLLKYYNIFVRLYADVKTICESLKNSTDFRDDVQASLRLAYFDKINRDMSTNSFETLYYLYLINTIKLYINNSVALGPNEYCLKTSTVISYDNYRNNTVDELVSSGAEDPFQYLNFSPFPGSTSTQTVQNPEESSNDPNINFSPSTFISTPIEDNFYDPNYNHSD